MEIILLIIAGILALPGGLFVAFIMSEPRAKLLSLLGGIIGAAVAAVGVYFFIKTAHVSIDALSFFYGAFFACSIGVIMGALVINFLFGLGGRGREVSAAEW